MKRTLIIAISLLIGLGQLVHAQDKKNVVKLSLISPFVRTLNLGYERVLNENVAIQLHAYYTGIKYGSGDKDVKLDGFGIIPEVRIYVSEKKTAPAGFFVAPFVRYDQFTVKNIFEDDTPEAKGSYSDFGAGLLIGIQAVFSNIVTLDAYIGPQYTFGDTKYDTETEVETPKLNGVSPRGGVTIGILF